MCKRFFALGAMLMLVSAPVLASAAEKDGPAVVVRLQSVDKTLELASYVLGLAGPDGDQAKQVVEFGKLLIGEKGIEGIDTKRPFIVYASLSEEIQNSQVVLMAPIVDQEAFLGLLKNRAKLKPTEKDGLYTVEVPSSPAPVYFRFANKYVYGTVQNKENVDEKKLLKPSDLNDKEESVMSLSLRVDRLPEQMKKFGMGFLEQKLAEAKQMPLPVQTEAFKKFHDKSIDDIAESIKALLFESKEVTLKLDITPKKDEFALEFDLSALDGSNFAKTVAKWKNAESIVSSELLEKAAVSYSVNIGLPLSIKKALDPVVDDVLKQTLSMAPGEYQEVLEPLVKAATPTLKSGDLDSGVALLGPDAKKLYTLVQIYKIKDGLKIEKAVKDLVKKLPGADNFVKVDEESIGNTKVHVIKIPMVDENAAKIFGESDAYLAFRDDMVVLAFGPEWKEAVKTGISSKQNENPLLKFTVNGAKLVDLVTAFDPMAGKRAKEDFAKNAGAASLMFSVEAGSGIKARIAIKGQALKFLASMSKVKKQD